SGGTFQLWVDDKPAARDTEREPSVDVLLTPASDDEGTASALRDGIARAERRVGRLLEEIELVQTDVRRALEAGLAEAERGARSWRPRLAVRERLATLPRARGLVVVLVVLAVGAVSWKSGLLWTGAQENLVLNSGLEATTERWSPAGLNTDLQRVPKLGRG